MYFGSVRFFKNLILFAVCTLILIPTLLAVKYYRLSEQSPPAQISDGAVRQEEPSEPAVETPPEDAALVSADAVPEADAAPEAEVPAPAEEAGETASPDSGPAYEPPESADPPDYMQLYPDFKAPQPYRATQREENTIYLTFDDGPSDRTDEILKILREKDVKATFFVVGKKDEADFARMRRIVEEGHTIGMHSFSHDYATVYASIESCLEEFYKNFQQIREATGVAPTVFRFPGGSINGYDGGFYQEIIAEMIRRGFVPFDWNISSEDAVGGLPSSDKLAANVVNGAKGKVRGFVLFHDSEAKTTTPKAVGMVIDSLRQMGFRFSAIAPETLPVLYSYPN